MFKVICVMFLGIGLGYALRWLPLSALMGRTVQPTIYLLLALLGVSVGADGYLMSHFLQLGGQALLLAVAGIAGSIAAVMLLTGCRKRGGGR